MWRPYPGGSPGQENKSSPQRLQNAHHKMFNQNILQTFLKVKVLEFEKECF